MFIKLTRTDGRAVVINIRQITQMDEEKDGVALTVAGKTVKVRDSLKYIEITLDDVHWARIV